MTTLHRHPLRTGALDLLGAADLVVEREDIEFRNETARRVAIGIILRNDQAQSTPPTTARLEAAPLGAFVAWQPLATLDVPALDPWATHVLRTSALVPDRAAIGRSDLGLPPHLLRTAGDQEDQRPEPVGRAPRTLPADPLAILGFGGLHWAGNLNVFVGGKATERHMAQALRVHPGVVNMAMFMVGSGRDAYRFSLSGEAASWHARVCRDHNAVMSLFMMGARGLVMQTAGASRAGVRKQVNDGRRECLGRLREETVRENEWIDIRGCETFILGTKPPVTADAGAVNVHVEQRSTGREAVVEFSLDPRAAGPGCFKVG